MPGVAAIANTYNVSSSVGELFALTLADTPFLPAIGGLTGGKRANAVVPRHRVHRSCTRSSGRLPCRPGYGIGGAARTRSGLGGSATGVGLLGDPAPFGEGGNGPRRGWGRGPVPGIPAESVSRWSAGRSCGWRRWRTG